MLLLILLSFKQSCQSGLVRKLTSKLQRRLQCFFVLCLCTRLGSFVLGVMLHQSIGCLLICISKPFVICARSTSYFNREKENKNITKKVNKFPNQSTLLTLICLTFQKCIFISISQSPSLDINKKRCQLMTKENAIDRKSVVQGKSVDLGGRRIIKKKKQ